MYARRRRIEAERRIEFNRIRFGLTASLLVKDNRERGDTCKQGRPNAEARLVNRYEAVREEGGEVLAW